MSSSLNGAAELTVNADVKNLDTVTEFCLEPAGGRDIPPAWQFALSLAIEEIFVNIASYAYAPGTGNATVRRSLKSEPGQPPAIVLDFIDKGTPYNPLLKEDPDITAPLEDRPVGGLGIFLVKKNVDDITYEYRDGKNILTIQKKFPAKS